MKNPNKPKKDNTAGKFLAVIFVLLIVGIFISVKSTHKYEIWYDTYQYNRDTIPYRWKTDFINNRAIEYSWYDSIDYKDIVEWQYYTDHTEKVDSFRIIGVFKDGNIIFSQKEIR